MRQAAAVPALGLLAGSAIGLASSDILPDFTPAIVVVALAISVLAAVWSWRQERPHALMASIGCAFLTGGCLLGAHAWQRAWRPSLRLAFEELEREESGRPTGAAGALVGRLRRDAFTTAAGVSLSLDVQKISMPSPRAVQGGILLTVVGAIAKEQVDSWRAGRTVRVAARLRRPSRYLNPGAPDEERALARRGTILVGTVKSGALVEVVQRGGRAPEAAAAARDFVRRTVSDAVGRRNLRAAAIVTAILIGDRAGLDDELQTRLQEAGTYHVVAISGGNIAILVGLTIGAFRLAGLLGRAAMASAMAGLVAYAYLVGGGASVDRATLMAVTYLAGRLIDLRGAPHNGIAVVAGILVAADPLAVADPAFLLTFGATMGILEAGLLLPVHRLRSRWRAPVSLLVASLAAEVLLLPVVASVFSRVTLAGLALNFMAIPLMAIVQMAGMLLVVVAPLSRVLASTIGWCAYVSAEALVRSASLVEFAPFLTWRVAPPGWPAITVYYAALAGLLFHRALVRPGWCPLAWFVRIPARTAIAVAGAGAAAWILIEPARIAASYGDGRLHVTFIDVGQGDAAVVQFPRGAAFVVDAGGLSGSSSFDVGDRVVAPVLRRAGVRRLDTLVLTHGDSDHIDGATSIVREFRPHDVWEGIPVPSFEPLRALRVRSHQLGVRWVNVQAGDRTSIDGVDVTIRHPALPDWERRRVRNDDSVVLELRWGDASIVLTGDVGAETETAMTGAFAPSPLRVLKAPHHGSLTSSTERFIHALAPRAAIVSAGRNNPFGHPAPAVLDRYRREGAEVFRTDQDGAVTVITDGRSMEIETFTGRRTALR